MKNWQLDIGARPVEGKGVSFRVWAPETERLRVKIFSGEVLPLEKDEAGYFSGLAAGVRAGARYLYLFEDGSGYPDPASRFQPGGVHGPSEVVDPDAFRWHDGRWKGMDIEDFIIYELHVGTFAGEGTFEAVIPHLEYLKDLGITALELMPVAQFPGDRNWGYDGVSLFAPQNSYGGPEGLKRLVEECHGKGMAVILDVVYNHLGPEGNYLHKFGPYFTDRYRTPWGDAVNFDGPYSDGVRGFFISNALYWVTEYHVDALRLDAIHGIFDFSARHILDELAGSVHEQAEALGRKVQVIAESDRNDVRVVDPPESGGYGLDAQWNDDFHHSLHAIITREKTGYYEDFGEIRHLEKAMREGFVYSGEYSRYRKRRHGSSTKHVPSSKLIVFGQNHDQVGNRAAGDRLSSTQSFEKLRLAACVVVLSPYTPLFFMGEEYGEKAPFQYFISHSDPDLIESVREGRRREFAAFRWEGEVPDPQAEAAFLRSKIDLGLRREGQHKLLLDFYKWLIRLRKETPALSPVRDDMEAVGFEEEKTLFLRRRSGGEEVFCLFNFSEKDVEVRFAIPEGVWVEVSEGEERGRVLRSEGSGVSLKAKPLSFALYKREKRGPG